MVADFGLLRLPAHGARRHLRPARRLQPGADHPRRRARALTMPDASVRDRLSTVDGGRRLRLQQLQVPRDRAARPSPSGGLQREVTRGAQRTTSWPSPRSTSRTSIPATEPPAHKYAALAEHPRDEHAERRTSSPSRRSRTTTAPDRTTAGRRRRRRRGRDLRSRRSWRPAARRTSSGRSTLSATPGRRRAGRQHPRRLPVPHRPRVGIRRPRRAGNATTATERGRTRRTGPQLSLSPGRIDPTNPAFANSRKPLAGEFTLARSHRVRGRQPLQLQGRRRPAVRALPAAGPPHRVATGATGRRRWSPASSEDLLAADRQSHMSW